MFVVCVSIFVKPTHVDPFMQATLDNARNTRHEPHNVRFDVLRADDDPTRFTLYEAYHSREDFAAHQQTPHYLRWKEAVADSMREPRQGLKHTSIFFDNSEQ